MAEGGHLAKTIDGSEMFYDFNCSVCIRDKGVHSEAAYYCPRCNEYYCKNCFTWSGCDHDTIGRGNVARWGTPSVRIQFDECPMHKTNTIQLYCEKDDVVCCAVCGQAHHKSCGDLKYIPSIASGTENKKSLKTAEQELHHLQINVEQLLKERTTSLHALDNTATQIKAEIRKVKEKIISILENLEQLSLNELDKLKIDCQDKIKSEILFLNNTKAEVLELLSKLRKHNIAEALLFSRLKQSKEIIQEKKLSLSDIASSRPSEKVLFVSDTKVLDCIKSLQGLGVLVIDTQDNQQTKDKQPFNLREPLEKKLEELETLDIIEKVSGPSAWVSPVVVIPKSNDIRLCVDMRVANEAVQRERYPIPTVDEVLHDMNQSSVLSKLDIKWAYHQVELDEQSREITTFVTHKGLYRYKRLMFGVSCAPEMYQKVMTSVLQGCEGVKNIMDDIVVHASDDREHDERVKNVLSKLKESGLTLNPEKCSFRMTKITFMGHVLSGSWSD